MQPNKIIHATFAIAAFLLLSGFSTQKNTAAMSQPSEERKAQESLPQAQDPIWKSFAQCKVHYNDKTHKYSITYTTDVKAMEGKRITVSGFMLPLEPTEKFTHFLLSKRTPTCPFCPPGEPNEIVEVFTKKPVTYDEGILVITGTMKFTTNPDLGLFFQLKDSDSANTQPPQSKSQILE